MGSEQPQPQSHSHSYLDSTTTTATTTTTTQQPPKAESTPPPPPPQASTSSKIPFRPRKIRKLSSDATPDNNSDSTKTFLQDNKTKTTKIIIQQIRALPRVVARTLSCEGEVSVALRHLRSSDPLLARVIDLHQPPTFDSFHPPFLALTKSILYQQLAFKAGTSIYTRFVSLCGGESGVVPEAVLALNPHQLRQIGVSARKASYLHDLANKYRNGILSDSSIVDMDDKSLFTMLTMVKGIGSWSVHMFMIFSLHRPDVLPIGDLGVRKGVQLLYGLDQLPRPSQMEQLCEKWRPYRSVASWYMWRFAEAKGPPSTTVAVVTGPSQQQHHHHQQQQQHHQQQQQQQQQQALQLIDPISGIANLG
ncbi:HhH-GPD domain [Macleaya cordata]|uniref:HhH-GPD domain n=1 Tax=Macleaya cordata TaxID=56857 RepID=A0A200R7Q0_MACCD|nr:HhH-GPD domain [Macleaya cordata]